MPHIPALPARVRRGAPASATALALFAACGAAQAQSSSVTIYGIIDAGVLTQNHSPGGKSLTRVETSGLRQSVIGFRGTEDLGDGLRSFFNLESHFDTDTGALHGTGDAPGSGTILFRRQANVGLEGGWGKVIVGRQYGPALLAHIDTEPRAFKEQFSNLYAWAYNQFASTADPTVGINTNNDVGIFLKNAVQYRATVGPVEGGIAWSFGEQAGSLSRNSIGALGLTYRGPVVLSGSYQFMKDQTSGHATVRQWGLGAALPVDAFSFKANFLKARNDDAAGAELSNVNAWGVGADWRWSPANTATLAWYDNRDQLHRDDATHNLVISNDHALSKRTTLYAQAAWVDAKPGATIKTSIVASGIPQAGAKTVLLNLGINHTF
ncbi:porin [Derxia gummosa]|uniref:Porin n=1 Tax=Derxia gummosa DSM 723 TaxID=1121388 RepID=A0A8B6X0U2_9BURK|nr:porin [Derxia gummosa]